MQIHMTFEWFLEKNNLQTAQEWNKSYIELISRIFTPPKIARCIFDHSRLDLENNFLPNKITQSSTYTPLFYNVN